ncbi:MAG TPA: CcmD family protein [Cyclobacteriaceae bacterium]|nr:CcmD family protein [Cyclobacteriaceae bacterium]
MMTRITLFLQMLLLIPGLAMAQTAGQEVEMADLLRSSGKIYVVVTVLTIIMTGLLIYLVSLDRKLSKLEKKLTEKSPS